MKLIIEDQALAIVLTLVREDCIGYSFNFTLVDAKTKHISGGDKKEIIACILRWLCRNGELSIPSKYYGFRIKESYAMGVVHDLYVPKSEAETIGEFIEKFQNIISTYIPGIIVDSEIHDLS